MSTTQQLKPTVERHLEGHWYWADLHTPDLDASTAFYRELFGWQTHDNPAGDTIYRMASRGGQTIVGMNTQRQAEREMGIPPHWFSYMTAYDLDGWVRKVRQAGGTIIQEPFDVMDVGRMAVVQDPTGAAFALWEAGSHPGSSILGLNGTLCWTELQTTDVDAALGFYRSLGFTVDSRDMGCGTSYHVLEYGGEGSCGIMQQPPGMEMPSTWQVYFCVDDVDATTSRVPGLGGEVLYGPQDIPEVGRFSVVRDPQGAAFSMIEPAEGMRVSERWE